MTILVTPNEIIAMNVAVNFYLRHCLPVPPAYKETRQLLDHYLSRLNAQIQPTKQGGTSW